MPDWTAFAVAVTALAVAVAALGGSQDLSAAPTLPWRAVVANAAVAQALVALLTLTAVWLADVPLPLLGVVADALTLPVVAVGLGLGAVLAALNGAASIVAERAGVTYSEELRDLLTPGTRGGWAALFGLLLPLVAVTEELLFRGALVLALAAGFGVSPWALAAVSSVLFGLAHGAQGRAGTLAAGVFGFALAASAVLTGALVVPLVAHYVVNAVEFATAPRR